MLGRTKNSRSWRIALTIAGALVALGAVAPASYALSPPVDTGAIKCTKDSGWCTVKADKISGETGWAQLTGVGTDALAPGFRWTDYVGWTHASIRTKNRWFSLQQDTTDWAILQAYDTGVWVAVRPSTVTLWLTEEYVKSRFALVGCVASAGQTVPPPPAVCSYRADRRFFPA